MRLSEYCGFMNVRDSLIRDRLILGDKNDRARKKVLEQKDLALDKALDILRTQELTDIRTSDMTTEEANVNRVKLRKTKTPRPRLRIRSRINRPQVESGLRRGSQKGKVLATPTTYALENANFEALFMR